MLISLKFMFRTEFIFNLFSILLHFFLLSSPSWPMPILLSHDELFITAWVQPPNASAESRPPLPVIPPRSSQSLEPTYLGVGKAHIVTCDTARSIARKILPSSATLSLAALELLQLSVINFISLVSSEAGLYALADGRERRGPPALLGRDIVTALESLGFEDYAIFAKEYLAKFQQQQSLIRKMQA